MEVMKTKVKYTWAATFTLQVCLTIVGSAKHNDYSLAAELFYHSTWIAARMMERLMNANYM